MFTYLLYLVSVYIYTDTGKVYIYTYTDKVYIYTDSGWMPTVSYKVLVIHLVICNRFCTLDVDCLFGPGAAGWGAGGGVEGR